MTLSSGLFNNSRYIAPSLGRSVGMVWGLNRALSNGFQSEEQRWPWWPMLNFNRRGLVDRSDGAKQSVLN